MFRQILTFRTLGHDSGEYLEIRLTKHLIMESIKYFCDSEKKCVNKVAIWGTYHITSFLPVTIQKPFNNVLMSSSNCLHYSKEDFQKSLNYCLKILNSKS